MKYWQLRLCVLERLNTEADTGSFKKIVNGRSIKFKDATHYNNKQNINEEIKDYNEENEGVKKMSLLYAKSHRNNGWFVNNPRQLCIYIYIYILHYYYATTMCFRRDWLRWWFLLIVAYPHNKLVCLCSVKFIKHFEHVSIFFILYIIPNLNYFANFFWATNLEGVLSSFS